MKKYSAILLLSVLMLAILCACNNYSSNDTETDTPSTINLDDIKSKLDSDYSEYGDSIIKTALTLSDKTKGGYKTYIYSMEFVDSYSDDYLTFYNILYYMRNGVSVNNEMVIIDGVIKCNNETYYISDYEKHLLRKSEDSNWEWNVIIEKRGEGLTNEEKKIICNEIQYWYDYYDNKEGKYSGDKHSDEIFAKISSKYHIPIDDLNVIWMKYYSY